MPRENTASVIDRRGTRDREPVDCDGVPTLPDWLLDIFRDKREPTPDEEQHAKPFIQASMAELRSRVRAFEAQKLKHVAVARQRREPRPKVSPSRCLSDLADLLAEAD